MGIFDFLTGSEGSPATAGTDPFTTSSGLINTSFDADNNLNINQDPLLASLQRLGLGNAGIFGNQIQNDPNIAGAADLGSQFRTALSGFDVNNFGEGLFNQRNVGLQRRQEEARNAQFSQALGRGRAGSTGLLSNEGDRVALLRAQNEQTQGLFDRSFGDSRGLQQDLGNLATNFSKLPLQMQQMLSQLTGSGINQALAIEGAGNAQAGLGGNLANTQTGAVEGSTGLFGETLQGLVGAGLGVAGNALFPGFGALASGFIGNDGPGGSQRV